MDLVVCDGTNKSVNHFYVNLWIDLKDKKIRSNLFGLSMYPTCNQSKKLNGREAKRMNLSRKFIPNPKS